MLLVVLLPTRTEAQRISLIRDAEIENTIRAYATPLFQAAGLSPHAIDLYLVKDNNLNAFVSGGQNIFINTGLLIRAKDPLEVIGVLAHETGHIAGGHIAGRGDALRQGQRTFLLSTLLGIAAGVASGQPGLGLAVLSGGQDIALKGLLRYSRAQESAADQAALSYLEATGHSPSGLLSFMQILGDQEALLSSNQDPYLRTHPLSRERVDFFENAVANSPQKDAAASAELLMMHERMRAKLIGFLYPLNKVLRAYPESDSSLPGRYARAIAYYRVPDLDKALALVDRLSAENPNDPYFRELKGQMLFENGQIAAAIPEYEAAVQMLPGSPTLHQALAQAQLEMNDPALDPAALKNAKLTLQEEPNNGFAWKLAATAYGRMGDKGMTTLALAESALARGKFKDAKHLAERAGTILASGSPGGLRASDLRNEAERRQYEADKRK